MKHENTSIEIDSWLHKARTHSLQRDDDGADTGELAFEFKASMLLPDGLEPHLEAALRYVLRHAGSLVRARVVYEMATAYGLHARAARDLGVAIEYFHTASLIFDDLPAMDNGASRRGAPCVHVKYGEASALLAALALINRAYAMTWSVLAQSAAERPADIARYVEDRLGVGGLLNGQSLDLNYSRLPHDRETTERVARGKTVSLIRMTLVLPAMLGGATAREVRLLERLAACWGLAYQMLDDLKDVLQSSAESGKTAARDFDLDRPNIALVVGVPEALTRHARLIEVGDRTLERLLQRRPALTFLRRLRNDMQDELMRVTAQRECAAAAC